MDEQLEVFIPVLININTLADYLAREVDGGRLINLIAEIEKSSSDYNFSYGLLTTLMKNLLQVHKIDLKRYMDIQADCMSKGVDFPKRLRVEFDDSITLIDAIETFLESISSTTPCQPN